MQRGGKLSKPKRTIRKVMECWFCLVADVRSRTKVYLYIRNKAFLKTTKNFRSLIDI
ncbi:MAG: hypothetical protein JWQ28_1819 [Pedobacter sp.]|jgi:hypothetical protein|nr:hypothetical protein [Pedobacter sp.]